MTERLYVVNKQDEVIGSEEKENKLKKNFISRNVSIYIKDGDDRFIVCQRAKHKSTYPGCLDTSAVGHVTFGETYEQAAIRELQEELGISCQLKLCTKKFTSMDYQGKPLQFFTSIFFGRHEGEVQLNEELVSHKKFSKEELLKMMEESPEKFVPAFREDFQRYNNLFQ